MSRRYQFYVYIMSNYHHTVFYTGVMNNIKRRVGEHKCKKSNFTTRYNCNETISIGN
ncbi:MAG: GIY-YIG nuclease family protein [Chitinophagaceae bacterium]